MANLVFLCTTHYNDLKYIYRNFLSADTADMCYNFRDQPMSRISSRWSIFLPEGLAEQRIVMPQYPEVQAWRV